MSVNTIFKKRILSSITLSVMGLTLSGLPALSANADPQTATVHITGSVVAKTCQVDTNSDVDLGAVDLRMLTSDGYKVPNKKVTLKLKECGASADRVTVKLLAPAPAGDDSANSNATLKLFNGTTELVAGTAQEIEITPDASQNAEITLTPALVGGSTTTSGSIDTTASFEITYP